MTTKRESIMAAIATAIDTINNLTVYRSRVSPVARATGACASLIPLQDTPSFDVLPRVRWSSTFRILLIVRGDSPDVDADPYISAINDKVLEDLSLGGKTMDIRPVSVEYQIEEADKNVAYISMVYSADYYTTDNDLTT